MEGLSVSEVAQKCGVSPHAVRYYDDVGLIPGLARESAGRRVFDAESLAWLEFVVCLRAVGMPIASIRSYVLAASSGRGVEATRLMRGHLDELRRRREQLEHYIALIERKLEVDARRTSQ